MNRIDQDNDLARRRLLSIKREPLLISHWERALFMHFEVEPRALQAEVPFRIDLREGKAYISLVAFTMRRMRLRFGGRLMEWCLKPMATHELLNLRTYVRHRGEAGIYFMDFMAEWIPNRLSAFLGPRTFGLPYRLGRLNYDHCHEEGRLRGRVENVARADHIGCGSDKIEYAADLLPQQKPESSEPSRPEANVPPLPGVQ